MRGFFALVLVGCAAGTAPRIDVATSYAVGQQPRAIAVADLDGDGRLDVVVANAGDNTLSILRGLAGGQLSAATTIAAVQEPGDVDAADLDGDGRVDLVVANHETSRITVLRNDGELRFTLTAIDTGARPHLHGLATADFDGDGAVDIAVESSDGRAVCIVSRSLDDEPRVRQVDVGTMPYYRLGVGDVTNDGVDDILVPGHNTNNVRFVSRVGGDLALLDEVVLLSSTPWMITGDDVDGDGQCDVIAVLSDAVAIWLRREVGFERARGSPFAIEGATEVATGDVDGDGLSDVVVGPWDSRDVSVIRGGSFAVQTIDACARPVGLAVADLNGDGRAEILAASATEHKLVVINTPD